MSRALVNEHHFPWTYEISVRLLCPKEDGYMSPEERGFETAQLWRRHWVLEKHNGETDIVDDFAVIGKNPIIGTMLKGEETMSYYIDAPFGDEKEFGTFSYCSMVDEDVRYFGGFLVFVPGRLDEGRLNTTAQQPFNVNLEKMEMTTPKLTW
eukprot:CAMPEP_0204827756 /NCGR_PEP_ID=MMETSP1346-20131115/5218_1 /ASSEMBLY_ACC=CAM_ASM_000771 /TAXON_ID=215587 /ORGANISM="Aplanochytrium stocchinoi, Strain GSBS06" /LENGTH=151 /DNA_ID=CAMNT_0051956317 /DNA_START=263 /DNA_END=715 /DNA_ORIENTATION=-